MLGKLEGKVAIVTGAGQGIGEGIARVFAAAGAKVIVATRSAGNGQETVDAIRADSGEATLVQCDVGSRQAVKDLVAATLDTYGTVDIAIHNAAVYPLHYIEDLSDEVLDQTLNVNMKAGVWLTQYCLPEFRKKRWGRIIFTSSVTGPTVAMPGTSHYAMSKGGMNGFIRTAALEYAREGITVNGVEPGYILTKAMSALGDEDELKAMAACIPAGHLGNPDDIANTMLFLAAEEAGYITGQTIIVDGGSTLPESQVVMDGFYEQRG
ncbi:SDR family oxidoreductase [Parahaliea mediterranea]|uniref:SDR family oxidoreductase n=1 Tax=Parahaliea mediterranea TaxID=651086 RepID=UPI000E2F6E43|nr:SDR family oxidoreductase [Parahaliea mediterranea]